MKILHTVQSYHPSVGGMQDVVKQLSERLVKLGHDVTVATSSLVGGRPETSINGVRIAEFDISGSLVTRLRGDVESYRRFLLESNFEVITNFAAQQWATDVALPLLDRIKAAKVFVPTGFSGLYSPKYRDYFSAMRTWLHKYDMNVFLSNDYRDIKFAHACGAQNITVIPNGAAEEEFLPDQRMDIRELLGIPRSHFLILHVGSHTGVKGHAEAIRMFATARVKNVTFLVIGNDFDGGCKKNCKFKEKLFNLWQGCRSDGKRLLVTALNRQETVAAYREADLFLFPSNIECSPLVLFECMASGTPFLSTDVGNAKEIADWSQSGEVMPTTWDCNGYSHAMMKESVAMLENLYRDQQRREKMAESGFRIWQERFTWGMIAREYESLYKRLVE